MSELLMRTGPLELVKGACASTPDTPQDAIHGVINNQRNLRLLRTGALSRYRFLGAVSLLSGETVISIMDQFEETAIPFLNTPYDGWWPDTVSVGYPVV